MKLASYKAIRPGLQGLANVAIRFRTASKLSHSEVVFEPGDGVDNHMPDGTCAPDADGALWCASSVAAERLPSYSPRRAGKRGGVRFKRIVLNPNRWLVQPYDRDPLHAARVFVARQGAPYNWSLIAGWVAWLINAVRSMLGRKDERQVCSQICAEAGGVDERDAHRFDPATLSAVVAAFNKKD